MIKPERSVPGLTYIPTRDLFLRLAYIPTRDDPVSSAEDFLEGRKEIDGAEGLWRVRDGLYDLEKWIHLHPGGSEWLSLTKGTDITEAFHTHHISNKAERLLSKFFVRNAKTARTVPLTFEPNGFYQKFKERALVALKDVDYHNPSIKSNMTADFLATMTILACIFAAATQTWISILIAAVLLNWTTISGHNYFHMRDNFRMYYFDMSLMSSKEWRITHALSHHMYPNTLWDYEIYAFEPLLQFLPRTDKSFVQRFLVTLYSPVIWALSFYYQGVRRYYSLIWQWRKVEARDLVPLIIPTVMWVVAPTPIKAIGAWLMITSIAGVLFHLVGLSAGHHHPDIFHDGDIRRPSLDWGLLELDTIRDRKIIDDVPFFTLTNFGMHSLHHLLPSVDHGYLPLCKKAFEETCTEFGISFNKYGQWEMIKGQFKQLARNEPRKNIR